MTQYLERPKDDSISGPNVNGKKLDRNKSQSLNNKNTNISKTIDDLGFVEPNVKNAKSKLSTWLNVENHPSSKRKTYLDHFKDRDLPLSPKTKVNNWLSSSSQAAPSPPPYIMLPLIDNKQNKPHGSASASKTSPKHQKLNRNLNSIEEEQKRPLAQGIKPYNSDPWLVEDNNPSNLGENGGVYSSNRQPKLTHKQIYDMVNAMTNRKPVRIDEHDNIFSLDYANATAVAGGKAGGGRHASNMGGGNRKQNVQINDDLKTIHIYDVENSNLTAEDLHKAQESARKPRSPEDKNGHAINYESDSLVLKIGESYALESSNDNRNQPIFTMTAKQPNLGTQYQKHQKPKMSTHYSPAMRSMAASSMDIMSHRSSLSVPLKQPPPASNESYDIMPTALALQAALQASPIPSASPSLLQFSPMQPLIAINPSSSQIQPILLIPTQSTTNAPASIQQPMNTTTAIASPFQLQPITTSQILFYPQPPANQIIQHPTAALPAIPLLPIRSNNNSVLGNNNNNNNNNIPL